MPRILPSRSALLALVVLAAPASAWAEGASQDPFAAQAALFRYDGTADLGVRELGVEKRDHVAIHDLTFAVPGVKEPVKAYLVVPEGEGRFAGALWVHWLGAPATSNRTEFLPEAVALAPRGLVSLLVEAMWAAPRWYSTRVPEQDYESSIHQVVALRRAMDLLEAQPKVDRQRLGFVGHDFGAMYGMLMGGVDRRAKTYVFAAATSSLSDWAFFAAQPRSKVEYLRQNAPLELTDYLHQIDNASTLFQFGSRDPYVSDASTQVQLRAAHPPKERRFYGADHSLEAPEAARDRADWLDHELLRPGGDSKP